MFIPLHDRNQLDHIRLQYVTLSLIGFNALIWLVTAASGPQGELTMAAVLGLGYIPAVANGHAELAQNLELIPEQATYLTYAFLHGGFLHLAGNMLFLWVFGDNVEDAMGHVRFLLFYCLCAVAGAAAHGLTHPQSEAPLIGASGAVAGVVTAYLILHPRVRVWVLVLGRVPLPLPAWLPLSLWIGYQAVMVVVDFNGDVSWAAHVGGIVAGAVLVLVLRRRGVPLFDRAIVTPGAAILKKEQENTHRWGR